MWAPLRRFTADTSLLSERSGFVTPTTGVEALLLYNTLLWKQVPQCVLYLIHGLPNPRPWRRSLVALAHILEHQPYWRREGRIIDAVNYTREALWLPDHSRQLQSFLGQLLDFVPKHPAKLGPAEG